MPGETERVQKARSKDVSENHLSGAKYFTIILNDGEALSCKLIQYGMYELLVDTEEHGKLLLPKHSIKFYKLDPQS